MVGQLSVQSPFHYFVSYLTNFIAAALAGGDDIKQRVLYWFFAFVTVLKYVIPPSASLFALSKYLFRNVGSFPPLHLLTSSFNQVSVSDHALDLVYVQHVFVFCVVAGDFMTAVLF